MLLLSQSSAPSSTIPASRPCWDRMGMSWSLEPSDLKMPPLICPNLTWTYCGRSGILPEALGLEEPVGCRIRLLRRARAFSHPPKRAGA